MRVQTGITILKISQNIDWLTANKDDRAKLYVVLRSLSDLTGKNVEELMEEAFGYKLLTGADYLRNFRRGAIAKPKAKLIHAWIAEHHNEAARTIAPELFPVLKTLNWNAYIPDNAIKDKLSIIKLPKSMGLIERARNILKPNETLKLGEKFCFEIDSDIDGYAVAFQGYQNTWHPLPLGEVREELITPVKTGKHRMPMYSNNQIIPLCENEDLGVHRFLIVISADIGTLPETQDEPLSDCATYLTSVEFTP